MARIAGVDLPRNKRVEIGLTYIFGIGLPTSHNILEKTSISPDIRIKDLAEEEIIRLRDVIDHDYVVEGDLRREVGLFRSIGIILWLKTTFIKFAQLAIH